MFSKIYVDCEIILQGTDTFFTLGRAINSLHFLKFAAAH